MKEHSGYRGFLGRRDCDHDADIAPRQV